jgi:hypothetical protein
MKERICKAREFLHWKCCQNNGRARTVSHDSTGKLQKYLIESPIIFPCKSPSVKCTHNQVPRNYKSCRRPSLHRVYAFHFSTLFDASNITQISRRFYHSLSYIWQHTLLFVRYQSVLLSSNGAISRVPKSITIALLRDRISLDSSSAGPPFAAPGSANGHRLGCPRRQGGEPTFLSLAICSTSPPYTLTSRCMYATSPPEACRGPAPEIAADSVVAVCWFVEDIRSSAENKTIMP